MSNYDFSTINDKEFEILVRDLLSAKLKVNIERFKPGKDSGVDGRYFSDGEEVIIQCKHWLKTGYKEMLKYLKDYEINKVNKLKPKKYIFATTLPLSRINKAEIKSLFEPYIKTDSDIYGNEDLNDILSEFPEIEKRHYKLWLASTNILKIILKSGIIGRSNFSLDSIKESAAKYVETINHKKALNKLKKNHTIIITGAPGIGKTTLADQLCLYYTSRGFEFVNINDSISEAEDVYNERIRQIFYYDDFLGRNFLLALEHNQDSKIVQFIKRVSKDSKKRFILTSRTNIINQGKHLSDLFEITNIEKNEYELKIKSIRKIDKAKILYNHIWYSHLKTNYINEIYKDHRYLKIVEHYNFNPRLISFITDSFKVKDVQTKNYWNYIESILNNPKEVWRHVFEVQLNEEARHIIIGVVLNGKTINEDEIKLFINRLNITFQNITSKTANSILRVLSGSLLNRYQKRIDSKYILIEYDIFDPSIGDFVIQNYLENPQYVANILACLNSTSSLTNLRGLYSSKVITKSFLVDTLKLLTIKILEKNDLSLLDRFDIDLIYNLLDLNIKSAWLDTNINSLIYNRLIINNKPLNYEELYIINSIDNYKTSTFTSQLVHSINQYLQNDNYNEDELTIINFILQKLENEDLQNSFRAKIIKDISYNLTMSLIEQGRFEDAYNEYEITDNEVNSFVISQLLAYDIKLSDDELKVIRSHVDYNEIINYNIDSSESYNDNNDFKTKDNLPNDDSAIHDLFDRN